jgi:hypothetical protein
VLQRKLSGAMLCLRYPLAPLISAHIQRRIVFGAAVLIASCAKELAPNSCKHPNATAVTTGNIQASRAVADPPEPSP